MKLFKQMGLVFTALASWLIIGMSGSMRELVVGRPMDALQYAVLLFAAVWYLQWALDRFLFPLDLLPKTERRQLLAACRSKKKAGSLEGITGVGHFLAILYILSLFLREHVNPDSPNLMTGAVFFMILGTMAEARTLLKIMVEERAKTLQASQQPDRDADAESAPCAEPGASHP